MKILPIFLTLLVSFAFTTLTFARVTPQDIVNSKLSDYNSKVKNYSENHQKKLMDLSDKISRVNKQRTDELSQIMDIQGRVLDEYVKRNNFKTNPEIDKARYWITYAHEAVAYQAAKIYVFDLTSEGNIKGDALNLISLFQSDLNSTRAKVINSGQILEGVLR